LVSILKPLSDAELENKILGLLSYKDSKSSNELHREIRSNKARFTQIRNKMITNEWIRAENRDGRLFLTKNKFESPKFENEEWTNLVRINCEWYLKNLKKYSPICKKIENRFEIKDNLKPALDAFFHQLDRLMIVHTRLAYAENLGLTTPYKARQYQKICMETFQELVGRLTEEHKEFKNEIIEYAQSKVKTITFKV
jgi:hypothetical protein